MRKPAETKRYERIIKQLNSLDDESLQSIAILATQLRTARRIAKNKFHNVPRVSSLGQAQTPDEGESHEPYRSPAD